MERNWHQPFSQSAIPIPWIHNNMTLATSQPAVTIIGTNTDAPKVHLIGLSRLLHNVAYIFSSLLNVAEISQRNLRPLSGLSIEKTKSGRDLYGRVVVLFQSLVHSGLKLNLKSSDLRNAFRMANYCTTTRYGI